MSDNNHDNNPRGEASTCKNEADADPRRQQLQQWLQLQGITDAGESASSDASFRRYFRYRQGDNSVIAMDAPPDTEDCRPFVYVARLLADAGVIVPEILAQDVEQGFLLLSDLGRQTLLEVMKAEDFSLEEADQLFSYAIETIIRFQKICDPGGLPVYDDALLRRELDLFPQWYLGEHLKLPLNEEWHTILEELFAQLIEGVTQQAYVFVHRDYMPRNLMAMDNGVGVLDFQDAVRGPVSYDPICLFKDAFVSWPEQRVESWLRQYWQRARLTSLPVPASFELFLRDCDYMGVQRHLKVIGIFARIWHRDGKPHYFTDVPRFFNYLSKVSRRRPELAALRRLLQRLEGLH